jgi:hypothetical protein
MKSEKEEFIKDIGVVFNDEEVKNELQNVFGVDVKKLHDSTSYELTMLSVFFHMECVKNQKINIILLLAVILDVLLVFVFAAIIPIPILAFILFALGFLTDMKRSKYRYAMHSYNILHGGCLSRLNSMISSFESK